MVRALSDVRVLDLTQGVAGPYCTKLLADYGADVLKIEKPVSGDSGRGWGPFSQNTPHLERSGLFLYLNTNKKSITLNLKSKKGQEIFSQLLRRADIVAENFPPGTMARWGLDYSSLEKIHPRLVLTSISNFGQTGPYRDYQAKDITVFALGGVLYTSGWPELEPVMYPGPQSQLLGGLAGAVATMLALFYTRKGGTGQQVDVSLMEAVLNVLELTIMKYPYAGYIEGRYGSVFGFYPWNVYKCKDGYVSVCVNNRQWRRVGAWLDKPELNQNPAYQTPADRFQHQEELEAIIAPWCLERTQDEIVSSAQKHGIPAIGVYNARDMLEDNHYRAREFFIEIEHPLMGKLTYPGAPFKMSLTPWQVRNPAPLLGEHNQEIYANVLGYSEAELNNLRKGGVI